MAQSAAFGPDKLRMVGVGDRVVWWLELDLTLTSLFPQYTRAFGSIYVASSDNVYSCTGR